MNNTTLKKLGGGAAALGGLLALIGGIGMIANSESGNGSGIMGMAILSRVGAIIAFIAGIALVAAVFRGNLKKGAAVTGGIFAVIAFIAQFMINPLTSEQAALAATFSRNYEANIAAAGIGMLLLIVSGVALIVTGIISAVGKNKQA